jgi:hypothetical protein
MTLLKMTLLIATFLTMELLIMLNTVALLIIILLRNELTYNCK